jgi:hypothetical protein
MEWRPESGQAALPANRKAQPEGLLEAQARMTLAATLFVIGRRAASVARAASMARSCQKRSCLGLIGLRVTRPGDASANPTQRHVESSSDLMALCSRAKAGCTCGEHAQTRCKVRSVRDINSRCQKTVDVDGCSGFWWSRRQAFDTGVFELRFRDNRAVEGRHGFLRSPQSTKP